jgi:tetratricopeptide (TPR) repeat protein
MGIAHALHSLGAVAYSQGDPITAGTLHERSLAIRRELGDRVGIAASLYNLGMLANSQGDYDAARTLSQESLRLYRETGHSTIIHVLGFLGHLEREVRDYVQAASFYRESLLLRRERGDVFAVAQSLEDFAVLAGRQGQSERAVRLLGAQEAVCEAIGRTPPVADAAEYERTIDAARAALSAEAFAAAWEQGRVMTLEQAVAYALERESAASAP